MDPQKKEILSATRTNISRGYGDLDVPSMQYISVELKLRLYSAQTAKHGSTGAVSTCTVLAGQLYLPQEYSTALEGNLIV